MPVIFLRVRYSCPVQSTAHVDLPNLPTQGIPPASPPLDPPQSPCQCLCEEHPQVLQDDANSTVPLVCIIFAISLPENENKRAHRREIHPSLAENVSLGTKV